MGGVGAEPGWCALIATRTTRPEIVDRADFDPSYDPSAPIECEVCGSEMKYLAACKIGCGNCGYRRDCSDP